jgi:LPS export ABC transporter protein LptC
LTVPDFIDSPIEPFRPAGGRPTPAAAVARRVIAVATLLVAASTSLACNTQTTSATPRQQTAVDSAEQVMYNGRMAITSNGIRRGEVAGDTILAFDAATRFDIRPVRIQFTTALGRPLAAVAAPRGEYSVTRSTLETHGAVTITSDTTGRRLTATAVRYDPKTNQIASDSAFTATAGTRRLTGVGFTADPGLFTIKCVQRCSGSLGR